jgi:hypothetical protein
MCESVFPGGEWRLACSRSGKMVGQSDFPYSLHKMRSGKGHTDIKITEFIYVALRTVLFEGWWNGSYRSAPA